MDSIRMVVISLAMTMILTVYTTNAYPAGPPVTACSDMTPQHEGSEQTGSPPYTVASSETCYTPGTALTGKALTIDTYIGWRPHCIINKLY